MRQETHLLVDAALLVIAIGLRRGAFADYDTLDALLEGRDHHIVWKPEFVSRPFFAASGPRGGTLQFDCPLRYEAMRKFLAKIIIACGIGGESPHRKNIANHFGSDARASVAYFTAYCFRRGFATMGNNVFGSEFTKTLMHHRQASDSLQKHYAGNVSQTDLVAAALYGEKGSVTNLNRFEAPALHR